MYGTIAAGLGFEFWFRGSVLVPRQGTITLVDTRRFQPAKRGERLGLLKGERGSAGFPNEQREEIVLGLCMERGSGGEEGLAGSV